jgi:hypothetical protein
MVLLVVHIDAKGLFRHLDRINLAPNIMVHDDNARSMSYAASTHSYLS